MIKFQVSLYIWAIVDTKVSISFFLSNIIKAQLGGNWKFAGWLNISFLFVIATAHLIYIMSSTPGEFSFNIIDN